MRCIYRFGDKVGRFDTFLCTTEAAIIRNGSLMSTSEAKPSFYVLFITKIQILYRIN